jgi:hypothetical protein
MGGELHDFRRPCERGVRRHLVAAHEIEHQIARGARMELRRAGRHGLLRGHHRRQVLVVDDERVGRVLRLRRGLRHEQGYRLADVAYDFVGERQALREALVGAVLPLEWSGGRDRLESRLHQLLAGDHCDHARMG